MAARRSADSLITDHDDDSVENHPLPKKSKGGEKDQSSVSISQEDKSSVSISQEDSDSVKKAFDRWCLLYRSGEEAYPNEAEKEERFQIFKNSFHRKVDPSLLECGVNLPQYADRNEQEFYDLTPYCNVGYCRVTHKKLDHWEEIFSRVESEDDLF